MLDDSEFIQAVREQLHIAFCEGNENNAKHTLKYTELLTKQNVVLKKIKWFQKIKEESRHSNKDWIIYKWAEIRIYMILI